MGISKKAIIGSILGTAVGDSLGLSMEGLSPQRIKRLYPSIVGHTFLFRRGMVSDDTEHTVMVARALRRAEGNIDAFTESLIWHLRFWILSLPSGLGKATLIASVKLLLGFSPPRSAVHSAGNGPSMRSALLGLCYGSSFEQLRLWVHASTVITHSDPKAYYGALTVSLAAHHAATRKLVSSSDFLSDLKMLLYDKDAKEFLDIVECTLNFSKSHTPAQYLYETGLLNGITGYTYHTVPAVLYCFFRHADDFEQGIKEIISLGGDTDSTAAILGSIIGARVGEKDIPDQWKSNLCDWPLSVSFLRQQGAQLAVSLNNAHTDVLPYSLIMLLALPRNLIFLLIVLSHGLRRLLPPY